jgi:hypothetical protein
VLPDVGVARQELFWISTGEILAVEFGGLLVVFGAWKLLKRLPPAT